ncbi:MAG: BrnT family toxin [Planctomycetes bacterium]|nr:BrnT family toxin [Planctomycetota bacterium]
MSMVGEPRFEWDPRKDRANRRKHGVSFSEARTVFFDEGALMTADPDHSDEEDRFLIIGFSIQARVLLVCFCERRDGDVIRIISARRATKRERRLYGRLT